MGIQGSLFLVFLAFASLLATVEPANEYCPRLSTCTVPASNLSRSTFPDGFIFGASASAYQLEGEAFSYGKKPSIWDTFTHQQPERIVDRSNGDVAINLYNLYKGDLNLVQGMNMDAFRFSISWSRLLPNGKVSRGVNKEGVQFYNNLINNIIAHGMKPFVTLFHWDFPQELEKEYGGFLNSTVMDDFRDYANLCFQRFGDRVKYWTTLNEPWAYASLGYDSGAFAPGRCSPWIKVPCPADASETCVCKKGNSGTEPYVVGHNLILSHAAAVKLYREKYKAHQNGSIGFTLNSYWYEPASASQSDIDAASRTLDFVYGWALHPVTYGDYPKSMRKLVGSRLPHFTDDEVKIVKGSLDFLGFNYYSSYYVWNVGPSNPPRYLTDYQANISQLARNGSCIGQEAGLDTNYIWPEGLRRILSYTKNKYNNPLIYITENGLSEKDDGSLSDAHFLNDTCRTKYYIDHLGIVNQSIVEDKVNIAGYLTWSYADNFELTSGYTVRFGLVYVNHATLKRTQKASSYWMTRFLDRKGKSNGMLQVLAQETQSSISKGICELLPPKLYSSN